MNDPRHLAPVRVGEPGRARDRASGVRDRRVIAGQDVLLERTFVALLACGHLLLEGVPGLAKTLTIKTSRSSSAAPSGACSSRRTSCPPTSSARASTGPTDRVRHRGSGRSSATSSSRTRSTAPRRRCSRAARGDAGAAGHARQADAGGPSPFLVMATQNPIESEGTYPLPEAQLDRFMLKVLVDYPEEADELVVIDRALAAPVELEQTLSLEEPRTASIGRSVYVDPALVRYAQQLAGASATPADRPDEARAVRRVRRRPARPSTSRSQPARAALRGRSYVVPTTWAAGQGRLPAPDRTELRGARGRRDSPTTCSTA